MSNWSELSYDLLVEIAQRVKRLEDFVAFGAVCKGWCKAGKKGHFKGLWLRPTTPYLLLPVRDENDDDVREFYSLVEDEIVASISIPKFKKRKCHESLGWLLAVDEDGSMCLLDPFSSVEIPLPHQRTFPGYNQNWMDAYIYVTKMVLSARPSETSNFIVMILCGGCGHSGFWRPGDESWNKIELVEGGLACCDVMYHDGHFYAIGNKISAWVLTIEGHNPPEGRIITRLMEGEAGTNYHINHEEIGDGVFYILKTSQSLFIIRRTAYLWNEEEGRLIYKTRKFRVYEIDMCAGTWAEINNIGSMAIFVGQNATFAVDTSRFSGKIKDNHIYFSDDGWECYHFNKEQSGGKDMGAYNLETRTFESFYSGEVLLNNICPSIWVNTPSF